MPKYESQSCPVRELVEHICGQTIRAMQRLKTKDAEDTALHVVLDACNEALSHVHRSPHFPEGRLDTVDSEGAHKALEEFLRRFPKMAPLFAKGPRKKVRIVDPAEERAKALRRDVVQPVPPDREAAMALLQEHIEEIRRELAERVRR